MLPLILCATSLTSPVPQETLVIVQREGDPVSGVGSITRFDGLAIADDGSAFIEADTDNSDTNADSVLLFNGSLFEREGQSVGLPVGATLGGFDGMGVRPGGLIVQNLFLDGTAGTNDDSGVYRAGMRVIQEGDVSTAAGFSPGTPYIGFFDAKLGSDSTFLIVASVDDPNVASSVDRALVVVEVNASGAVISETVIAKEGDVLPGQTEAVADFETGAEESAINSAGDVLYSADLAGDTTRDLAIYLNQTLLIQEGSPSPIAGRNWGSLTSVELDLNEAGDWVLKANLDSSDTTTDDVLVKNGAIVRRAGETLPAIAPFVLTDFGGSVGTWITDTGDVIWFGDWDDPDTSRDEGIFINDRLVLQEGVTQIGGQTIIDLSDITEQVAVSADGSRMLLEAVVDNGGVAQDVVIEIVFDLGSNYCSPLVNSTGERGTLRLLGSDVAADNDFVLMASPVPHNVFGFFFTSRMPGMQFQPGYPGTLCLGLAIGRYVGPGQVQNSGATGAFSLTVDLTQQPTPNGLVTVLAGDSWYFQAWHRDLIAGQVTSVFTDASTLTFR